jgi:HSP20 family protein
MDVVKWNPFRELEELQKRMTQMFGETPFRRRDEPFLFADWMPEVDVQETENEYAVKADLPDVKKEDVKVELEDGVLTIEGERKHEKEEKGKKFHRVERRYGQFIRRMALPRDVDASKVQAEFKEGVLTVRIPKTPNGKAKAIEIKVA